MSAEALQQALREQLGVSCDVRAEGAVAVVLVPGGVASFDRPEVRRAALALSAEHGFRNLALEVVS